MFRPEIGPFLIERRKSRRSRATCVASLETPAGESFGQLWDLSETGARVEMASPPQPGTAALLKWASEKVACEVIWAQFATLHFLHAIYSIKSSRRRLT